MNKDEVIEKMRHLPLTGGDYYNDLYYLLEKHFQDKYIEALETVSLPNFRIRGELIKAIRGSDD